MAAGVDRVLTAIERGEKVALYGDYDVDGVSSLAILTRVLGACGVRVSSFLPHRIDEGYGLSAEGVQRCLEEHQPKLLLAVDCGTTSVREIASLNAAGVDVIVIDHHEPGPALPDCVALINPKLGTANHHLCSAGLAFKFAHALLKRRSATDFDLRTILDLVALGTVADLVPLIDENRILVKHGLQKLGDSRWTGVRALVNVSGLKAPFTAPNVGFGLGPRLNAAGRLGTAQDALELLLTDDGSRAHLIAQSLDAQNKERRAVEDAVFQEAVAQLESWYDASRHAGIVVGSPSWHPGVVGIVASRLLKRYHRPTIVIGFDEAGVGKGSGRSIRGLALVSALAECSGHLQKYGGHEMAAGLSIALDAFEAFREAFLSVARATLSDEHLQPEVHLDAELPLGSVGLSVLDALESLEPFGIGHRAPLFFARKVWPVGDPRVLKEKHLSLVLSHAGREARAIWFGGAANPLPRPPWDLAFEVTRNEYMGRVSAQVQVLTVREHGN